MLDFMIKYRSVIDAMTADKTCKLRRFELETEEWTIAQDLITILLQYKNATLYFSQDSASVTAVIPAMDRITSDLNYQTGKTYHPSLAAAMKLACKKLDRYYSLTNASSVYRIAMVLHPGMKLEYSRNQKWEQDWIEEAECLVREVYVMKYEKAVDDSNTKHDPKSKTSDIGGFASFGDLSVTSAPHASEIQEYLSFPVDNIKEPLKWWVDNKNVYPNLHRMALDYLSIPGKSYYFITQCVDANFNLFQPRRHLLSASSLKVATSSLLLATTSRHPLFGHFSVLGLGLVAVLWSSRM
jgi:hypothetical protein